LDKSRAVLAPSNLSMIDATLPKGFASQNHTLWARDDRGLGKRGDRFTVSAGEKRGDRFTVSAGDGGQGF